MNVRKQGMFAPALGQAKTGLARTRAKLSLHGPNSIRVSTFSHASMGSIKSQHQQEQQRLGREGAQERVAFVDSERFSTFMAAVVVANVVLLSAETDTEGSLRLNVFKWINEGFLLVYGMELVLRFVTHGLKTLSDRLTLLDVCIVLMAFVDRITSERGLAKALPSFRLLRIFRLLRLIRTFRNVRELNVLMANASKAAVTFLWVLVIFVLLMWACATCVTVVVGQSPRWNNSMDPLVKYEPFSSFDRREYFGSVLRSGLTLLQLVTLSQWAGHFARQVVHVYPVVFFFFVGLLFATTYGLFVGIVSNVVQEAIVAAGQVQKAIKELELEDRRKVGQRVLQIFKMVNVHIDAQLGEKELRVALKTTELPEILRDLQVPVLDAEGLMSLFDREGSGFISSPELVTGILSMNDDIHPKDFLMLAIWASGLVNRAQLLERKLSLLHENVVRLRRKLEDAFSAIEYFIGTREEADLRQSSLKAIRSAPPPEPPGALAGSRSGLLLLQTADPDEESLLPGQITSGEFALPLAIDSDAEAFTKSQLRATRRNHLAKRWVTVASPFVPMRDWPDLAGNHIAALKTGDFLEFKDLPEGRVRPEHLKQHAYLKCRKVDEEGIELACGWVVGFSSSRGAHFVPWEDATSAGRFPGEVSSPSAASEKLAAVRVSTPMRSQPSPEGTVRTSASVSGKAVLPPPPPSLEKAQADVALAGTDPLDKYAMRGLAQSPSLLRLKELLT